MSTLCARAVMYLMRSLHARSRARAGGEEATVHVAKERNTHMPSGADAMATASGDDGATRDVLKQSWYHRLGSPKHILAPMVDQSECAFRVLCRNHGCDLAYSPMYSSKQFAESELYRNSMINHFDGDAALGDRPLVIQFAGNDPQVLLEAAKHVQHRCNAVDLNLGCPQKIARRGHYGAWYCMPPSNA